MINFKTLRGTVSCEYKQLASDQLIDSAAFLLLNEDFNAQSCLQAWLDAGLQLSQMECSGR